MGKNNERNLLSLKDIDAKDPSYIKRWATRLLYTRKKWGWAINITTDELVKIATESPAICSNCDAILIYGYQGAQNSPNIWVPEGDLSLPPVVSADTLKIVCTRCSRAMTRRYKAETPNKEPRPRVRRELTKAKEHLYAFLAVQPQPVKNIKNMISSIGISPRTLRRAKAELKLRPFYQDGVWYWALTDESMNAMLNTLKKPPKTPNIKGKQYELSEEEVDPDYGFATVRIQEKKAGQE